MMSLSDPLSLGFIEKSDKNFYLRYPHDNMSYNFADAFCQGMGAHLANLRTPTELEDAASFGKTEVYSTLTAFENLEIF